MKVSRQSRGGTKEIVNYYTAFDSAVSVTSLVQTNLTVFEDACDWYAGKPKAWGRYLGTGGGVATPLTKVEAQFLHSQGVSILLIYNDINPTTLGNGYAGGVNDAQKAINSAKSLGVPANVLIVGDLEMGWPVNAPWIEGWANTMKSSIYGGAGALYGSISQPYFTEPFKQALSANSYVGQILLFGAAWNARPWSKTTKPQWSPPSVNGSTKNIFAWQASGASYGGIVDLDLVVDPLPQVDSNPITLWMPPVQKPVEPSTPSQPTISTTPISNDLIIRIKSLVNLL